MVLAAVAQSGEALFYASAAIQRNAAVVARAAEQYPGVRRWAAG